MKLCLIPVNDISGDGSTLVGSVYLGGGSPEAYRWTASDGIVRLGLGTGGRYSDGAAVSYDGSTTGVVWMPALLLCEVPTPPKATKAEAFAT